MTTTDTLIDRVFDKRYVIKRKLGSGGMADVYLAEDQELGRRVALKLLDDRHSADGQFVERFRREAQSAAGLNHPNIVVGSDGRLKVTDFGIARSGASQMTEAGSIVGTAQYLSPEQARGAPVDPRSDLYSLGIVLYEMLTGKVPFAGDTPVEIAMKHLSQVPEPPSELKPEIPHDLDAVVMRALAKDPDHRYASAEEMDADLARVARGIDVSRETEEAMRQMLSGAGISTAATMVQRPRSVTPP